MKGIRKLTLESSLLIVAAIVLGFAYTYISKQGFFSREKPKAAGEAANLAVITLDKAKEYYESHNALFIDSRHNFEFENTGHIHGSINIPLNGIDTNYARLEGIPKEKVIIVYCDGAECNSSFELAVKLTELKFTNVKIFFGGWQEWKSHNYPIDYQ